MVLVAASLVLAAQPSLAFVARFYKTGSIKSRFELYVSDLSGGNRKTLPTTVEPDAVQWLGSDRLAWRTAQGIYTSKLSPWKPALIAGTKNFYFRESRWRNSEPGYPHLTKGFDDSKGVFTVDPSTLKIIPAQGSSALKEYRPGEDDAIEVANPSDPEHPLQLKRFETFRYWWKGKEKESDWEPIRAVTDFQDLWITMGSHDSTVGDVNAVMVFPSNKEPRVIFESANAFDFWWSRTMFAYCTSRELTKLNKKEVWTSELHVGDWTKGTDKTVLKGLVWVPSVSIRP